MVSPIGFMGMGRARWGPLSAPDGDKLPPPCLMLPSANAPSALLACPRWVCPPLGLDHSRPLVRPLAVDLRSAFLQGGLEAAQDGAHQEVRVLFAM